jgi:ferrochelatase
MNDEPLWIDALATISEQHMQGWPTTAQAIHENAQSLACGRNLAMDLGAKV